MTRCHYTPQTTSRRRVLGFRRARSRCRKHRPDVTSTASGARASGLVLALSLHRHSGAGASAFRPDNGWRWHAFHVKHPSRRVLYDQTLHRPTPGRRRNSAPHPADGIPAPELSWSRVATRGSAPQASPAPDARRSTRRLCATLPTAAVPPDREARSVSRETSSPSGSRVPRRSFCVRRCRDCFYSITTPRGRHQAIDGGIGSRGAIGQHRSLTPCPSQPVGRAQGRGSAHPYPSRPRRTVRVPVPMFHVKHRRARRGRHVHGPRSDFFASTFRAQMTRRERRPVSISCASLLVASPADFAESVSPVQVTLDPECIAKRGAVASMAEVRRLARPRSEAMPWAHAAREARRNAKRYVEGLWDGLWGASSNDENAASGPTRPEARRDASAGRRAAMGRRASASAIGAGFSNVR